MTAMPRQNCFETSLISSSSLPTTVSPICLINSFLEQRTTSKYTDTLKLDCSPAVYERICAAFPSLRLSYFYPRRLLIITAPGSPRQRLLWPGWSLEKVGITRSTDHLINDGEGGKKGSVLQPDGGLDILGLDDPFLVIEVADTQNGEEARAKAEVYLKRGRVRFVVIVDMVRSKQKKMKIGEGEAAAGSAGGVPNVDAETIPAPTPYAQVLVSVLSRTRTSPRREVVTLVSPTEVWPAPPPPESAFSFTWEDMGMKGYPEVLRGRVIKVGWMWLHEFLVEQFQVQEAGSLPIPDDESGEWEEETEEDEGGGGEDEAEAEQQSGSDGSYRPSQ